MAKTYNDIYIETRRLLKDAGIEAYAAEAKIIVSQAAGKTTAQLLRDLPLYPGAEYERAVRDMTRRRLDGEPVAYVTGGWEFYGVPLVITRDVLIPRTDTELMAEAAIALFRGVNTHPRILDLCAGSGCIGCALAVHMPGARVILADNDRKALAVCRKNVTLNRLDGRVLCVEADAAHAPPMLMGTFDLIVCNAPYIPTAEIPALDASVRDYEPVQALDGGRDGLDIIRPVAALWKSCLRDSGTLMLEIGEGQYGAVRALMEGEGFRDIRAIRDAGGTDRIVIGHL